MYFKHRNNKILKVQVTSRVYVILWITNRLNKTTFTTNTKLPSNVKHNNKKETSN